MEAVWIYLFKVHCYWSVLVLFYYFFLRKETFHHWKRVFLWTIPAICFVFPFLSFTNKVERVIMGPVIKWVDQTAVTQNPIVQNVSNPQTTEFLLWGGSAVLWIISLWLSFRLIMGMIRIQQIIRQCEKRKFGDAILAAYCAPISIFSYFRYIVYNPASHSGEDLASMFSHEMVHVKERHSFDILWAKTCHILFFYNPLIWLYGWLIRENNEFIADAEVIAQGQEITTYQLNLLNTTLMAQHSLPIPNYFNKHLLKNRIMMMNKITSKPWAYLKFILVMPLIFGISLLTGQVQVKNPKKTDPKKIEQIFYQGSSIREEALKDKLILVDNQEFSYSEFIRTYPAVSGYHNIPCGAVLKGESVLEEYGEAASNGVLLVYTDPEDCENKLPKPPPPPAPPTLVTKNIHPPAPPTPPSPAEPEVPQEVVKPVLPPAAPAPPSLPRAVSSSIPPPPPPPPAVVIDKQLIENYLEDGYRLFIDGEEKEWNAETENLLNDLEKYNIRIRGDGKISEIMLNTKDN